MKAQQTYTDAIEAGESAFLMEEDDEAGDVFECKVGNLPPHTQVEITFAYVQELEFSKKGEVEFVYPCILPERYTVATTAEDGRYKRTLAPFGNGMVCCCPHTEYYVEAWEFSKKRALINCGDRCGE